MGELFNVLTTSLEGEPLWVLYNCNFNGLEAWRRSSERYSPTTVQAMQLVLQIISREETKDLEHVQSHIDRWESKILALGRGFDEKLSERMKAAILLSTPPSVLKDVILQNPDKFEQCEPMKERAIAIVEAKLSVRSVDVIDAHCVYRNCYHEDDAEERQAVGKGGVHCYRCGGQCHRAT